MGKQTNQLNRSKWPWILAGFVFFVILLIVIGGERKKIEPAQILQEVPKMSIEEIKNTALKDLNYDELLRNNEKYIGKIVYYRGQTTQVTEVGRDRYILRVYVTKDEYGLWDDDIWVNYEGKRVLEEDIIDLWGEVKGIKKYTTVLGASRSIPEINALLVEVVKKTGEEIEKAPTQAQISKPVSPKYQISTLLVDHEDSPAIQVTVEGKKGGLDLILSGPNKNTVDTEYISEKDMLDGAETVWLYLQEYVGSTASPGIYTLIIKHWDEEVYRKEFNIKGAKISILSCTPTFKYYEYFGYDFDRLTIKVKNEGDLPAYFRTLDIILNGKEGVSGGYFSDDKLLAGETKTIEMRSVYYGNFPAGIYKMTLKINGQINGKPTVLTTFTTTISVP